MKRRILVVAAACALASAGTALAVSGVLQAKPDEFDPGKTMLVQASWLEGLGCPTAADTLGAGTYTDPACPTGDPRDRSVEGLVLAKTGPTANAAAALARIRNVKGVVLTRLGYDIRKPGLSADPRGSHCGAGAPRFNVTLENGARYFIGCNSPPADEQTPGAGWLRLRWGAGAAPLLAYNAQTGALEDISGQTVEAITIVFDEGQDTGPDNHGLAVLDNITVNGRMAGTGAVDAD